MEMAPARNQLSKAHARMGLGHSQASFISRALERSDPNVAS